MSEIGTLLGDESESKQGGQKILRMKCSEFRPRDSLLEQLERRTLPPAEMANTLSGMHNILFMLVGVSFLQQPLFRLLRGQSPIDVELLVWSFRGFWKTSGLFLMASLGTWISYGLHSLAVSGYIAESTREAFHRVGLFVHILLSGKLICGSDLSPIPSFALSCQAVAVFMKMHSYFVETRRKVEQAGCVGPEAKRWVSLNSFLYFIFAPTLVYRPQGYPQTKNFRAKFFARKLFAMIGLLMTMYLIATESILPILPKVHEMRTYEFLWSLILPCSAFFLASFLILFEAVLNIVAEATKFADRLFYEDWWNSTTLDEFSRKWNRPVHDWLERHIYRASLAEGFPKKVSMSMTFLFSGIFHEWVLALTFRRPRLYLFFMMIAQMPLIMILRGRFQSVQSKRAANIFLWFGFFIGLGLLCSCYAREWYIDTSPDICE
eukprot:Plantae.Rhodophyta-Purpureofilum_apyrenoidigerum.ctg7413.p1 GENE.Plantae.Rhodophyta-Purpureofilum_apyrenoidigerum.ctg7413~~Plantae.Rhodophyta-Purpureofilum_apyrenoidigerum.ctg7413.p1  ORF type:complete len:435 (-),score=55.36 Plantae.Rhodophyta-Purpureofilum_apyrenoidigerum.ctg7413:255-1559(-)